MVRLVILRLLESYFRHRWLYLLPIVVMLAAGSYYVYTAPVEYIASGTMYVPKSTLLGSLTGENANFTWRTPAQVTSNQIRELIKTEAFVRAAISKTDLEASMSQGDDAVNDAIEQFRNSVWTSPIGDNLISFGAISEDPQLAEQLASSTISTYINWNINSDKQESEVAQSFFATQIEQYQQQLEDARNKLRDYLESHPAPLKGDRSAGEQIELQRLQANVDRASGSLSSALDKQEAASLELVKSESLSEQTYMVIDAPKIPTDPRSSLRAAATKALPFPLAGVALTIMGIIGAALLDRSFRFGVDVRHGLDLPVLATIPFTKPAPNAAQYQTSATSHNPDVERSKNEPMVASTVSPVASES